MNWTEIEDVAYLDTAVCSISYRDRFLKILSQDLFVHMGASANLNYNMSNWVLCREFKVQKVCLSPNLLQTGHQCFQFFSSLRSLKTNFCNGLIDFLKLYGREVTDLDLSEEMLFGDAKFNNTNKISDHQLEEILTILRHVKKLNIQGCTSLTNSSISRVGTLCVELETINMCGCFQLTTKAHIYLTSKFTQLNSIQFCCFKGKIIDKDLKIVFKNCLYLEKLVIKECDVVTNDSIIVLADNCSTLRYLELTFGHLITDVSLCHLVIKNKNLQQLLLHECNITDHFLMILAQNCIFIKKLFLDCCYQITNVGVVYIAESLRNLTTLSITGSEKISDISIMMLARNCSHLRNVNLSGIKKITDLSAAEFMQFCPCLTNFGFNYTKIKLEFVFQKQVTNYKFTALAIRAGEFVCEDFSVSITSQKGVQTAEFNSPVPKISSLVLQAVLLSSPHLLCLTIEGYDALLDKHLTCVFEMCTQLKSVKLVANRKLTIKSIVCVGALCKNLQAFHVGNFYDLTDDVLCAFFCAQSKLSNVSILCCEQVSDASMNILARICGNTLKFLHLNLLPLITNRTMETMQSQCKLTTLSVIDCGNE
jgi:hypothetical protein